VEFGNHRPLSTCGSVDLVWGVRSIQFQDAGLFAFLSQDGSGTRIHVMDLAVCWTGHRLIYVVILRNIFGRKALNAIAGFRAAVHEERHVYRFPLRVPKWIYLDQSPKRATAKFKGGQRDGKGPVPQKETPTEIGASRYCWQLGSEH